MLIEELIKIILPKAIDKIDGYLLNQIKIQDLEPKIEKHIQEILNWCSSIEMFELSQARDIDTSTIFLDIAMTPKKLGGKINSKFITEKEILGSKRNILLLGDPGAGKTTMIKRLALQLIRQEPTMADNRFNFPIVIRLRTLAPTNMSLYMAIADALGISYQDEKIGMQENVHKIKKDKLEIVVGNIPIEKVIPEVLNSFQVIVFVDGLDEVDPIIREEIEADLSIIANKLSSAMLFVTSRSGAYVQTIEGFDVYEISALSIDQINQIANKWLDDPKDFIRKVTTATYSDIINRPLSLVQLIILYQYCGYLPEQPYTIYQKTVELYIDKWDHNRRIKRRSKYSNFYPEKKIEYLAAMAFRLFYFCDTPLISFTPQTIESIYKAIHSSFGLPERESKLVTMEIESHTGIIIDIGNSTYEFSHLSIQEYLCSYYLVRSPFNDNIIRYLFKRPAPVAIAIASSPDPNGWLHNIFLNSEYKIIHSSTGKYISDFLYRLSRERPSFLASEYTGFALLRIAFDFYTNIEVQKSLKQLIRSSYQLIESLKIALNVYECNTVANLDKTLKLTIKRDPKIGNNLIAPGSGLIKEAFINLLTHRYK